MPKKLPTYPQLRARMAELGYTALSLGEEAGISGTCIGYRMQNKTPWGLEEVYSICRVLGIPTSEIPRYWPEGGGR